MCLNARMKIYFYNLKVIPTNAGCHKIALEIFLWLLMGEIKGGETSVIQVKAYDAEGRHI